MSLKLSNENAFRFHLIKQAMLVIDAAAPITRAIAFQRLWFSDAFKRSLANTIEQSVNTADRLQIIRYKPTQFFLGLWVKVQFTHQSGPLFLPVYGFRVGSARFHKLLSGE